MNYLEIKLWKCQNATSNPNYTTGVTPGVTCKSQLLIDEFFRDKVFNFAFSNTYFASDDFENPIKNYIDDQLFFDIDPRVSKKANLFVMNQEASLEDDILQFGQSKDLTFH